MIFAIIKEYDKAENYFSKVNQIQLLLNKPDCKSDKGFVLVF